MNRPDTVQESSEMYLAIGPFVVHHSWEQGSLGDQLGYILKHYANFIVPAHLVDRSAIYYQIPLYPGNPPPGAMKATNVMTLENQLRPWAAREARKHGGFLFHAAGVLHQGRGWLFPGRSGAGKTTLVLKLAPCADLVLSDEVCIALPVDGGWKLWGTPFFGTGKQGITGPGCPLEAVIFPHREREIAIERLELSAALPLLLRTAVILDKATGGIALDDAIALLKSCRSFNAGFSISSTTSEVHDAIIAALSS